MIYPICYKCIDLFLKEINKAIRYSFSYKRYISSLLFNIYIFPHIISHRSYIPTLFIHLYL